MSFYVFLWISHLLWSPLSSPSWLSQCLWIIIMLRLPSLCLTDTRLEERGATQRRPGELRRDGGERRERGEREQKCFSWAGEDRQAAHLCDFNLERWGSRKGGMIWDEINLINNDDNIMLCFDMIIQCNCQYYEVVNTNVSWLWLVSRTELTVCWPPPLFLDGDISALTLHT